MSDRPAFSPVLAQTTGNEPAPMLPPLPGHVLDQLTQSIFVKDRSLRFVLANQAFCRGLDTSLADLLGKDDFAFYPRALADKFRAADRGILREGICLETEEQILCGGKLRTVRLVKTPHYGPAGIEGVVGMFWDVTDQRHLENQVRKAQKMEAVGQLAGGIAQDFNNLLAGILGNLALARKELPEETPLRTILAQAEEAGQRAADLTRQLLGFSRRIQPHPEPLDVNLCAREAFREVLTAANQNIDVKLDLETRLWKVQADPGQLEQVLRILTANARDAMPGGGCLVLETANITLLREPPQDPGLEMVTSLFLPLVHSEARPGQFVRVRLRDSGLGIAPNVLTHLFEPFFSTKELGKGTGLNLAMVYGIVKEHDGWIECHSTPGQGTAFDIYLPRLLASCTTNQPALSARGRERILLADDQETVRCIGREILESYGYRVLLASNGVQAVEIFEQEVTIDLVLLDYALPELELTLHQLRGRDPEVRVVISAAFPTGPALKAVQTHGAAGFIAKPYQPLAMARNIRAALDQPQLAATR